jgi:hypothetical protein
MLSTEAVVVGNWTPGTASFTATQSGRSRRKASQSSHCTEIVVAMGPTASAPIPQAAAIPWRTPMTVITKTLVRMPETLATVTADLAKMSIISAAEDA